MKKILMLLLCAGCLHDPYAYQQNYYRDALWCYHKTADGTWVRLGLARQCPDYTKEIK